MYILHSFSFLFFSAYGSELYTREWYFPIYDTVPPEKAEKNEIISGTKLKKKKNYGVW